MPAVGALLLALSEASRSGFGNLTVLGLLGTSLVLFVLFVLRERRARHPLVDLTLFRSGTFSRGVATGLLGYLVLFGSSSSRRCTWNRSISFPRPRPDCC
ncbi:multidrug resistance protein stp [Arthrobacter sp. Hiyo8]|nr:multidrug resistance protein stp [Arthrobacter sp. Hiyo8]